ncbi:PhoH family protein [Thioflexithrix psekupsensis]|uniref:Phosphate starvation-inducible protein PhoH n=1 Tax=Thioflexithrix psekupsensis TaxID=1570016 RepID=A0A251XBN5_9GAMM|nr:PhoH family protein [Thioflexithrix psekupsensis]OUD15718.1 phosphate starvation-inducible protein PhoH [Thioflexithrix psekupsensis]
MSQKRLFILDTNVLMHDPAALFRFHEHNVYLPMVVLEELDAAKKGMSEVARNVRQVSRFLDQLISQHNYIEGGIPLPYSQLEQKQCGYLFFQTQSFPHSNLPESLPGNKPDNSFLSTAIALQRADKERKVTIVSKDINLRIKAHALGIHAEDYTNDKVLDDADLLYTGKQSLPDNFWDTHSKELSVWKEEGRTFYKVTGELVKNWYPNEYIFTENDPPFEAIVRECENDSAIIESTRDFRQTKHHIWGINARNPEQNFALNLLMDPEIDFVTLLGAAGTGKTLLALAAGLAQTLDQARYREIIVTRVTIPVGEDIGFLPGTEEEKMTPWMGAFVDNLEVLTPNNNAGEWARAATTDLLHHRIKIRSLNFMRGRTFLNRYIILDEAQNLTSKQMKTLITRAGPGSKLVCLGNLSQIDTPYLTETTSGLTYVVDRFKSWAHGGHITLQRGERSRLADFASQVL